MTFGIIAIGVLVVLLVALIVTARVKKIRLLPRSASDRGPGSDAARRGADVHRAADISSTTDWSS